MILTILFIAFIIWVIKIAADVYSKETVNSGQESIPDTIIIPKQIPAYQQVFAALSDSEVLTYFEYKNGIITLRFKNGHTFSKRLNECVFQIGGRGKPPRLKRYVSLYSNSIISEWAVVENDSILEPRQWNEVFAILCQAGKTVGTMPYS